MAIILRTFLTLLAVLSVLSVGWMQARGAGHGLTEMVICADGVEKTISVDASGTPVEPADCTHCPDCLPGMTALLAASPGQSARRGVARRAPTQPFTAQVTTEAPRLYPARAPPLGA